MARQKRQFIQASILIKSSALDISQRQFARTSWFLAHGQFFPIISLKSNE